MFILSGWNFLIVNIVPDFIFHIGLLKQLAPRKWPFSALKLFFRSQSKDVRPETIWKNSIYNRNNLKTATFIWSSIFLTYFMPLVSLYTPWKQKTKGFPLFSGGYRKRPVVWNGLIPIPYVRFQFLLQLK